jgi:hypothetical protein
MTLYSWEGLQEPPLAIREKALGPEHPDTATGLNNLALLLRDQGPLDPDAQNHTPPGHGHQPRYIQRQNTPRSHIPTPREIHQSLDRSRFIFRLSALTNWVLQAQGDLAAARPLYERALAISEKVRGPEHPDTARSLNNLALLRFGVVELGEAAVECREGDDRPRSSSRPQAAGCRLRAAAECEHSYRPRGRLPHRKGSERQG